MRRLRTACCFLLATLPSFHVALGAEPNYHYLDEPCNPYYVGTDFPKLTTPQWVGEEGVEAVITLGIDDMRDTAKYEQYLRPLLERLKKIDGRAPVSIFTCNVPPDDPQLQKWIDEGLSFEVHTIAHPCPLLQGGDFAKAKKTVNDCIDLVGAIPNNKPAAFRFPCCDSLNTPSPRAFAEILNKTTTKGNFLQADSSVICVLTSDDPDLPKELTTNKDGSERFRRYIPFPSFVNTIENYPYPYLISGKIWELPIMLPDDWVAQNIQQPNNPRTVDDMMAAVDATVIKKGIANFVFHPHGWIRSEQMADLVDRVEKKYDKRVKFLNFQEVVSRINKHLLLDQPVRTKDGGDNGVRVLDLDRDGFMDVLVGNHERREIRVWEPERTQWDRIGTTTKVVSRVRGKLIREGVSFGISNISTMFAHVNNETTQAYHLHRFAPNGGHLGKELTELPVAIAHIKSSVKDVDQGVRFRDIDGNGTSELIEANPKRKAIYRRIGITWKEHADFPVAIVDEQGRDNGVRFVDIDRDGHDDVVVSNDKTSAIFLYEEKTKAFTKKVEGAEKIPNIVAGGMNNGAWFAKGHMWLQNENTNRLPDGVDRRSFDQLLGKTEPNPRSPKNSLNSIQVRPGFHVELVASEPLVMDPIAIDWGPDGKLWVVEMADYPLGLDDKGEPGGRVRYLEDTDRDGRYDKSTLFLDKIAYPTGVMAWEDGVLVSAAPAVFFAKDSNGDGKADVREDLYRGFGEGNQQHRVNGFEYGLDNWIYLANGDSNGVIESVKTGEKLDINGRDLRIRPRTGEMQAQAGRTQFGRHRDDHGNWFGCSNPLPLRHYVLDDFYLRRNRHFAPPRLANDIARVDNTQLFPISRVLSHWSGYKPPPPGQGHRFTSACSTSVYRDDLLGPAFKNNTFTCEPVHNCVHRRVLTADGVTFTSKRPADETTREFLASTDSWFRPATVTTGPNGAIYVVDMYRLVIEHPEWIDDRREKQLFLRAGHDRGRIYRVVKDDVELRSFERFESLSTADLVAKLASPNGRQRDMAQRLLVERADKDAIEPLRRMVRTERNPLGRLHALCSLDGLEAIDDKTLHAALADKHPTVRRHACRVGTAHQIIDVTTDDAALVRDAHPTVRLQLAYTLGDAEGDSASKALADLAMAARSDKYLEAAVFSSLTKENLPDFFAALSNVKSTGEASGTQTAKAARRLRRPLFAMASRMKNESLIGEMLNSLLSDFDAKQTTPQQLDELTATFEAVNRWPKLNDVNDKLVATLTTRASRWLVDEKAAESDRVAAVRFLATLPSERLPNRDTQLLHRVSSSEPLTLQRAAVSALFSSDSRTIVQKLLPRFAELSPAIRSTILDEILRRTSTTKSLMSALEKRVLVTADIGVLHREQLISHSNSEVKRMAVKIFGDRPTSGEIAALVRRYEKEVKGTGDSAKGEQVFKKRCSTCHRIGNVGHVVGPDLTALKNRSSKAMLTAILDPNQAVEDKYRSYNLIDADGRTAVGIIQDESSSAITLTMAEGKSRTILRDDIEAIRSSGKSLMPEGLHKDIPPADMSHLLAYVSELGPPPKSFDGNTPAIVKADVDGTLTLSAVNAHIYGPQLVYEPKYKNVGFWGSVDDRTEWKIKVARAGKYDVVIDYACDDGTAGNTFSLKIGGHDVRGQVGSTGSWDNYAQTKIGTIEVRAGTTCASLAAAGKLQKFLFDLRSVRLTPHESTSK